MNKSIVVKVQNLSKTYRLYDQPIDRMKEALHPFGKTYHKDFHALYNISLELKRGEALGVIGRNGNGKSTLLKIIAGVLTPTKGHVNTKGKIAAILELTSSLKPELTGLENIYFNLKINSFKKREIEAKVKEIEEFAEIGEFINQPVKTYSSGMKSRLGFGIATSIDPDILILDEVLAVGDFNFQQKCLAKINAMREEMSVIFVSHSMNSVRLFCDRVIVLEKGSIAFDGLPDDAIKYYLEQEEARKSQLKEKSAALQSTKPFYGDVFHNIKAISSVSHFWINDKGQKIIQSNTGDKIGIVVRFRLSYKPKNLIVGLPIWNSNGEYISGIATDMDGIALLPVSDNQYETVLKFKNILNPDTFINIISIYDGAESLYRGRNDDLEVVNSRSRYFGLVTIDHQWTQGAKTNSDKTIHLNDIRLTVDAKDSGGMMYDAKSSYEEMNNPIYRNIKELFNPDAVIDIGANYGFTGIVFSRFFSDAHVTFVEPSKKLCEYIEKNAHQNSVGSFRIVNAICAEKDDVTRDFALNPWGSQDNRVIGENEKWEKVHTETITLKRLIDRTDSAFYFIKIDTQGYEQHVFEGGAEYLDMHSNWLIKTEFAPYWLKSQGTDPHGLLQNLIVKYNVAELPIRPRYAGDTIESIIRNKIELAEMDQFIEYVQKHNKNGRGWCDLLVSPKNLDLNLNGKK